MLHNYRNLRGFLLPVALALAAAAALTVDVPIAQAFKRWSSSPTIHAYFGYFDNFEVFGHGLGVAVLLLAVHQLDPGRRWAIPRVLTCALAAGATADILKMLVLRIRPYECALDGTVWSTFGQWFPVLGAGSAGQSFPSGHTATAVAFAAALIWLYPQGRFLFSLLAILVGCQRIVCVAHYLSDVLIGAAAGCLVAQFLLKVGRLPVWFDQWEERWRQPSSPKGRGDVT
jgi:membrane-associated phospholipid phosphatase